VCCASKWLLVLCSQDDLCVSLLLYFVVTTDEFSSLRCFQVEAQVPVFTLTKDIGIPGLSLYMDFISLEDEQVCMYCTYNLWRVLGSPLLVTRSVDK
jgi:hypothetical protein